MYYDAPVAAVTDAAHQIEPQPNALFLGSETTVEHAGQILSGYTTAVVFHRDRGCLCIDLDVAVASLPADKIPRANTAGEITGLLKAVVDRGTGQILGCSLLCHSAGEVMSVVQMAMLGKLPYTAVRDTVFTHPTSRV